MANHLTPLSQPSALGLFSFASVTRIRRATRATAQCASSDCRDQRLSQGEWGPPARAGCEALPRRRHALIGSGQTRPHWPFWLRSIESQGSRQTRGLPRKDRFGECRLGPEIIQRRHVLLEEKSWAPAKPIAPKRDRRRSGNGPDPRSASLLDACARQGIAAGPPLTTLAHDPRLLSSALRGDPMREYPTTSREFPNLLHARAASGCLLEVLGV